LIDQQFSDLIDKKYLVYNSLFLSHPFQKDSNVGRLIPILLPFCKNGLNQEKSPLEIIDLFFETHTSITEEKDKINFMFLVIQYIERQVVLYDSIEDTALPALQKLEKNLSIEHFLNQSKLVREEQDLFDKLNSFKVRIVLTAHPTQFYQPSILDIISDLSLNIENNDLNKIDKTLQQLGLTSLINSKSPTPFQEAKNIIYHCRKVYYNAIGEMYDALTNMVKGFDNPELMSLGFWPGGDRDGNPYVTHQVTMQVADELRMTLMKCYYNDIKALSRKVSFKQTEDILEQLREQVYKSMFDADYLLTYEAIIEPLVEIRKIIIADCNSIYLEEISSLINKVNIFRTHFATLDIRQDHSVHVQTITEIFIWAGIINSSLEELSEEDLIDALINRQIDLTGFESEDPLVSDTIKNIQQLRLLQQRSGELGCNRYIISNSEDIFSVLFVFALMNWCHPEVESLDFDIVPLFETMIGMERSLEIIKSLFKIPQIEKHITKRNKRLTVMLGFSDGTKDGGYLKANWSILKTKTNITSLCRSLGYKVSFFDGRGGPPARGGGKTHKFYASQGQAVANDEIQLTVQGQTITSTFGNPAQFKHNIEQLITAGIKNDFQNNSTDQNQNNHELIESLSELSFKKYDALKKHEMFIPFLEKMSTLKYYGKAKIGSRPGKRGKTKQLTLSDLRAISFVGSWSQLKQNIPGYYGIGTALKYYDDQGKTDEIKALYNSSPYFNALISNSMMSLSKCYFELTAYMKQNEDFRDFWILLHEEYKLSLRMILKISGFEQLMEDEFISKKSIKNREDIVLPLLVIQQYGLQKIQLGSDFHEAYETMVTRSLYGNINASRNSA